MRTKFPPSSTPWHRSQISGPFCFFLKQQQLPPTVTVMLWSKSGREKGTNKATPYFARPEKRLGKRVASRKREKEGGGSEARSICYKKPLYKRAHYVRQAISQRNSMDGEVQIQHGKRNRYLPESNRKPRRTTHLS